MRTKKFICRKEGCVIETEVPHISNRRYCDKHRPAPPRANLLSPEQRIERFAAGGRAKGPKGFAVNHERAVAAGRKGGLISRKKKVTQ